MSTRLAAAMIPLLGIALTLAPNRGAATPVQTPPPSPAPEATGRTPNEAPYLRAGMAASVHDLDSTLSDSKFADWIQRAVGSGARIRWEVNDCGEGTGSAADSGRDLPTCVEAGAALSGGRELYASVAVGTVSGVAGQPVFWGAGIAGPDTTLWFSRLSDLQRFIAREQPILGNSRVYLDDCNDVHVVTPTNKDVRLTKDGRYRDPKQSPDGGTIGMLITSTENGVGSQADEPIEVATELWIYRGGRVIRRLEPGGYIRAWDFANGGDAVAVYSGALHFAGFYVLYDAETGLELGHAKDPVTDRSPAWVRAVSP